MNDLSMVIRTAPPPIKDPVDFDVKLPACDKHVLSNGVEVYAVDMGTEDTMMMNWVFAAGNCFEPAKGVAAAANQLIKNGTNRRSAYEVNEHFEFFGSYLNRSSHNETAEVVLHCLSKHLHDLVPAVAEIVADSIFPQKELEIYIQNSRQRLQVNLLKSEFVASRLIDAALFGEDHPYGRYADLHDLSALTREQLVEFHDRYYRHGSCVIFVGGKLPEGWLSLLENTFGTLPLRSHRGTLSELVFPFSPAANRKQLLINDAQGVQAAIRIGRHFPDRRHPDFQKAMVLNNLYGGFFGSRLMDNIREDKGYTYGIYSYIMNHLHEGGWVVSTEAGRDVSIATVGEIYAEMDNLREEPVDEEELKITQNFLIGSILGDLDGPFQVLGRWKNLVLNDLDENYFYQAINTIKTVTSEELHALAEKYLRPDDFYEVVVI